MSGAVNSNACPAGSVRIETEAACRTAAAAAGRAWGGAHIDATDPRGCFYYIGTNYAFFNAHAVGAGYPEGQLLCAAAGAPIA